jgi:hypothetical protein
MAWGEANLGGMVPLCSAAAKRRAGRQAGSPVNKQPNTLHAVILGAAPSRKSLGGNALARHTEEQAPWLAGWLAGWQLCCKP